MFYMPFVDHIFDYVNNDVFLETGTFQGDTVSKILNKDGFKPSKIISLELSKVFFERCVKRFENDPSVVIHQANSKYDLYSTIKNIDVPITFWLDSHWSCTENVGCDTVTVCPILEELDQIKQHPIKTHTIIIDDIRLMNLSNNMYEGFPVSKDEIIKSIYEINPNYTIKYYDDYTSPNDVLVAFIENKICIHKYLTTCTTNPLPPGLADYLRGTIALFTLSKKYGFKLLLDNDHPIFKFLNINERFISNNTPSNVTELLPPLDYQDIYNTLNSIFKKQEPFVVMTNSFYCVNNDVVYNWGEIPEDCCEYLRDILIPTAELNDKLEQIITSVYNLQKNETFKAIHIRTGDMFIRNDHFDETMYNNYYTKICNIINNDKNSKYILISDSSIISIKLKNNIKGLLYWDNKKVHLGELFNINESSVLDTLIDFFLLSKSSEIISNGSGFSYFISLLYKKKYNNL